tara:strand:+ start:551 stop:895 length:345 start_codon:yes stop_codon:yes gene_type:complete
MKDETIFIERLLNAPIFKLNTPDLLEKLQGYQNQLITYKVRKNKLMHFISIHENQLGRVMESTSENVVTNFYHNHDDLEMELLDCTDNFKSLKEDIYNYIRMNLKNCEANVDSY